MQVDRLIVTARAQTIPGPLSSEAIVERVADGSWEAAKRKGVLPIDNNAGHISSSDRILLATGKIGAGEQYIQAVEALQQRGIVAIIAPAFAWPFLRLCLNIGLSPLTLWEAGEIRTGDRLRIDVNNRIVKSMSAGSRYPIRDLPDLYIEVLACGGLEGYVRARLAEQRRAASSYQ